MFSSLEKKELFILFVVLVSLGLLGAIFLVFEKNEVQEVQTENEKINETLQEFARTAPNPQLTDEEVFRIMEEIRATTPQTQNEE